MRQTMALAVVLMTAACGSSSSSTNATEKANPCATPGASYLVTFVEQSGGTCGPIPSTLININPDGTIALPSGEHCAAQTQDGCTARDTDCTLSAQGVTLSLTFETTFASDGSSAQGLETITGMGSTVSCLSTYAVTMTRH